MIKCYEVGQYISKLKAIFNENCKKIQPTDILLIIEVADAIRRCNGEDDGDSPTLPEDIVLYTPQSKEEFEKKIARINIGATSTEEVLSIIQQYIPEFIDLIEDRLPTKTSDLINDGETGVSKFVEENEVEDIFNELIVNVDSDKHFEYEQSTPSNHWVIQHNLNKKGSVTITDSAGTIIEGQVIINDGNRIEILFNVPFWGFAYIN